MRVIHTPDFGQPIGFQPAACAVFGDSVSVPCREMSRFHTLPTDVVIGDPKDFEKGGIVKRIGEKIPSDMSILDIGPETKAKFGNIIAKAKTVIWNGPVGLFENPHYRQGTDFIYYAITHNPDAISMVGGGDTLAAISKKEYLDKITHISTGGGAMLELIEKGTLPGIEALKK